MLPHEDIVIYYYPERVICLQKQTTGTDEKQKLQQILQEKSVEEFNLKA